MVERRRFVRVLACLLAVLALVASSCTGDDGDEGADGRTEGDGTYEATIRRTSYGIPHIVADDLGSVSFGQGYASAEDHLCTLADQVVKIRSERAKYHGAGDDDENLNSDLAWLHIGLRERAEADYDDEPAEVHELLAGFVAGWNDYLAETGADAVPGWCAGEPWVQPVTELDLYTYARSIAVYASSGQLIDFIATAQPPDATATTTTGDVDDTTTTSTPLTTTTGEVDATTTTAGDGDTTTTTGGDEVSLGLPGPDQLGSNGWAVGAERTEDGTGMLVANPHFPWEGELRFWESHLTVPGEYDVYGAQLLGLPGVGIGFTPGVAWTHTVSAGNRFTAYTLDLAEGDPTAYRYGDDTRDMTETDYQVEVLADDGSTDTVTRTLWSSHYGPIIDFPGAGWTDTLAVTYRDANIDNTQFIQQYLAMNQAQDLDELIAAHQEHQGVPLFNTVAVGADGRTWYADTSATPNLSDEAIELWTAARTSDLITAAAWDSGAVVLDGSDPTFEWVDVDGARSPGLVPYDEMPQLERDDYVFNANDSFWLANADVLIVGDYSPLHGLADTARSPRTRENAVVLDDTSGDSPSGDDGLFTLDELQASILFNQGYTARVLQDAVVERCTGAPPVDGIDLAGACTALAAWDGLVNLDSSGAVLWRELLQQFDADAFTEQGPLWAEPFDPADPVGTPSGLAPAPADGPDPVLVNLAAAVRLLDEAGVALDTPLGEVQYAPRGDVDVPIHGGGSREGVPNVVGRGGGGTDTEEAPDLPERISDATTLTPEGYPINNGTSFLMTLEFTDDGPVGFAFLTYGESGDRASPQWSAQTELFSAEDWRPIQFTDSQIEGDGEYEEYTVSG